MNLHLPTLLFIAALAIAFTGALLVVARGTEGDRHALGLWGASMILGAVGLVMAALEGSSRVLPRIDGVALYLVATAMSWTAARVFAGRRPWIAMAALGPAVHLLQVVPGVLPALGAPAAFLIGAAYTIATAAELWFTTDEVLPSRAPALALLALHGLIYGTEGVGLLLDPRGAVSDAGTAALVVEGLLHTIGMAMLLLAMAKERTEQRSTAQLRMLAALDGLTGISNRRRLDEHLDTEVRRSQRRQTSIALLMIDVDWFKQLNDALGHQHGDTCLRAVAGAIAAHARRPGDLAARFGGEEFAVVLSETGIEGAMAVADKIRAAVQALPLRHPGEAGRVTVSIGVSAIVPVDGASSAQRLVTEADRALYEAKSAGRNRVFPAAAAMPG